MQKNKEKFVNRKSKGECYEVWAIKDMVDAQQHNTEGAQGADLNKGYNLGSGTQGHEAIIKSHVICDAFLPFLNK